MPDTKLSALTAGTVLAAGDLFVAVDVSDATMAASGTDKRWTVTTIVNDPLFAIGASGAGAPGGSGTNGQWYYDTTGSRAYRSDGTGWIIMSEPDVAWVPVIGGITIGNGVKTGSYHRSDGWIDIAGVFTLGTTSAVTGDLSITLPINSGTAINPGWFKGHMGGVTGESPGLMVQTSVSSVLMRAMNAAGTYIAQTVVTNLIPFTWATGDRISIAGRYPMTTKYS